MIFTIRGGKYAIIRHPGEGRDLTLSPGLNGETPAFAGVTE
jgi:hypothetical protein